MNKAFSIAERRPPARADISPPKIGFARWDDFAERYAYRILTLLFLPLFVLILLDRRALSWDEAFYAEYSISLFRTLIHSPLHWPNAMVHALYDRAPALVWIGQFFVPLEEALPLPQTSLLVSMLALQMASILLLYRALQRIFGVSLPPLIACCFVASGSLFTGMTYRYFVDPLQALSVVWLFLLTAYEDRTSRVVLALELISAVAFGLLVKTSTPLYQFPLVLYLLFSLFRKRSMPAIPDPPRATTALLPHILLCLILVVGVVAWYSVNFVAAYQHVVTASSGELSIYYGSRGSLLSKFVYWTSVFEHAFVWQPLSFLLVIGFVGAVLTRLTKRLPLMRSDILTLISMVWIVSVLLIFSRTINEDTRYLIGFLPYVGIVICWSIAQIRLPIWSLIFAVGSALQFFVVTGQSYGAIPATLPALKNYLSPYTSDDTALQDSVFAARNTSDSTPQHPTIVGCEIPDFNAVGLSLYSTLLGGQLEPGKWVYTGFDWTQTNPDKAWQMAKASQFKYYVYRTHDPSYDRDTFNHVSPYMLEKVRHSKQFRFIPAKSNTRVFVYERKQPDVPLRQLPAGTPAGLQAVAPLSSAPFGFLDTPKSGSTLSGIRNLQIRGWAASPESVPSVNVAFDGRSIEKLKLFVRPDVRKAYSSHNSVGFSSDVDLTPIPDGLHQITVTATDKDGRSRKLADVPIITQYNFQTVSPDGPNPFGILEYPRPDSFIDLSAQTELIGWTAGPSDSKRIEVLLDGHHLVDALPMARPDVVKSYPTLKSTGYRVFYKFGSVSEGPHKLEVVSYEENGTSRTIAAINVVCEAD